MSHYQLINDRLIILPSANFYPRPEFCGKQGQTITNVISKVIKRSLHESNTQVTLHELQFALGVSQNTLQLGLNIAKVMIFQPQHTKNHTQYRNKTNTCHVWNWDLPDAALWLAKFPNCANTWDIFLHAQIVEYKCNL